MPSAAGLPPQPDLIAMFQNLLEEALAGKIVGGAVVVFDSFGHFKSGVAGKSQYTSVIGGPEDLKLSVMLDKRTHP